MTRFDAAAPTDRRKLFAEAIAAHRERDSAFLTVEADGAHAGEHGVPWVQFGDGVVNVDCTDDELERLKSLLDEFPAFKVDQLERPEDAEGTNVRVSALADAARVAQFVDETFRHAYELPEDYRAWVVQL